MLNAVPQLPIARQPRGIVKINGISVPWEEIEVDNNSYYQADTFRVTLPLSAQPASMNWAWWASQADMSVECFIGFPNNADSYTESDLKSFILGKVDELSFDPVTSQVVLVGRDLTSVFIDSHTTEKFVSQTASQIATTLATRHGLTPVVTTTTTQSQIWYAREHARITREMSEWDLLAFLAQEEGFILYVKGMELHFEPAPTSTGDPYVLSWNDGSLNGINISFARNFTLAKDVIVTVKSWGAKLKNGFEVTAKATHTKKKILSGLPQPAGSAQKFVYQIANLSREDALKKAQELAMQISRHEVRLSADVPGDNLLTVTTPIQVTGTGTDFDQTYYMDNVIRRISVQEGYRMDIRAKNHATDSQVSA